MDNKKTNCAHQQRSKTIALNALKKQCLKNYELLILKWEYFNFNQKLQIYIRINVKKFSNKVYCRLLMTR